MAAEVMAMVLLLVSSFYQNAAYEDLSQPSLILSSFQTVLSCTKERPLSGTGQN